jgi:hypothetical protein
MTGDQFSADTRFYFHLFVQIRTRDDRSLLTDRCLALLPRSYWGRGMIITTYVSCAEIKNTRNFISLSTKYIRIPYPSPFTMITPAMGSRYMGKPLPNFPRAVALPTTAYFPIFPTSRLSILFTGLLVVITT